MLLQEKALEKKEVADRFAIAEDDDDLASAAELVLSGKQIAAAVTGR